MNLYAVKASKYNCRDQKHTLPYHCQLLGQLPNKPFLFCSTSCNGIFNALALNFNFLDLWHVPYNLKYAEQHEVVPHI